MRATPRSKAEPQAAKKRVLLALDCSLPRTGALNTVFYDEVDAGMGGLAAAAVARLLRRQARICPGPSVVTASSVGRSGGAPAPTSTSTPPRANTPPDRRPQRRRAEREVVRMTSGDVAVDAAQVVARALLDEGGERATV